MNDSIQPNISPAEAEEFFGTGEDARTVAPGATPAHLQSQAQLANAGVFSVDELRAAFADALQKSSCCVGVDLPEAGGRVHSADCPHAGSPVRSGCGYGAGEVSQQMRDSAGGVSEKSGRRNELLWQLVFAARDLAEANVADPWTGESFSKGFSGCRECGRKTYLQSRPHASTCRVGRVLRIVASLVALANPALIFDSNRKEAAPEGESRAGDGILSRGIFYCRQCESFDSAWIAEQRPEAGVWIDAIALNQRVGPGVKGKGHTLYTHLCAAREVCPHCGPGCLRGAAHNARVEDGVFYGSLAGELPAAAPASSKNGGAR